jgi:hypothetical protein
MAEPDPAWMAVLDRIEQALLASLSRTPAPVAAPPKSPVPAPLAPLDERLARWQACLERMEDNAREADGLLAAEQAALERWQEGVARVREALAGWVSRVGAARAAAPAPATAAGSPPSPPAT